MRCFMDKDRECKADCVAFVPDTEGAKQCGILDTGNRFVGLVTRIFKRQGGGAFPASAPPPEVTS